MARSFGAGDTILYATIQNGATSSGACSFRLKTTTATANVVPVAVWRVSNSREGFGFIINNASGVNKVLVVTYPLTAPEAITIWSTITVNDGVWHTITFNYNSASGGKCELFIDGVSDGVAFSNTNWWVGITSPYASPYLGSQPSFWGNYIGSLAEFALWDRNLDAAEVAALGKGFSPSRIAPDKLRLHAPLIRSPNDRKNSTITGPSGTSVVEHPNAIGWVP